MYEQPLGIPPYATVRALLKPDNDTFKVKHILQYGTLFCPAVIICPATEPGDSVANLNRLLLGVARVVKWDWVDPDDEFGDCIICELVADAST
jgi:hypothetical protein